MTVKFKWEVKDLRDFSEYLFVDQQGRVRAGTFCSGRFTTAAGQLSFDLKDVAGWWRIPREADAESMSL